MYHLKGGWLLFLCLLDELGCIRLNSFSLMVCVWLNVWAGRSAWNDRSVGIAEAAGSNPAPSTFKGYIWHLLFTFKSGKVTFVFRC